MESISGMEFEIVKAVYFLDDNFTESDIEKYVEGKYTIKQIRKNLQELRDAGYISQHGPYYKVDRREF